MVLNIYVLYENQCCKPREDLYPNIHNLIFCVGHDCSNIVPRYELTQDRDNLYLTKFEENGIVEKYSFWLTPTKDYISSWDSDDNKNIQSSSQYSIPQEVSQIFKYGALYHLTNLTTICMNGPKEEFSPFLDNLLIDDDAYKLYYDIPPTVKSNPSIEIEHDLGSDRIMIVDSDKYQSYDRANSTQQLNLNMRPGVMLYTGSINIMSKCQLLNVWQELIAGISYHNAFSNLAYVGCLFPLKDAGDIINISIFIRNNLNIYKIFMRILARWIQMAD